MRNNMVTQRGKRHDAIFRALADPTRRSVLALLRGGRRSVGEIASNFRTSRPAISRHLRILRTAGLVTTRADGTARICELNAEPLRAVNDWVGEYETFWMRKLHNLKVYAEEKR